MPWKRLAVWRNKDEAFGRRFRREEQKIENTLSTELEALHKAIDDIKGEKTIKESEWNERFSSMKAAHEAAYETVKSLYEKKLALEDQKYQDG